MDLSAQSETSILYHSLVLISSDSTEINTWDDWHLIPAERPIVSMPPVRTKYVEIPGRDGQLDLTEIHGNVFYDNRTGSWSFFIANGYLDRDTLLYRIAAFLHGKNLKVIFLDNPYYAYEGRLSISNISNGKSHSRITIDYNLHAKAVSTDAVNSSEGWLWDQFNFEMDRIDTSVTPPTVTTNTPVL